MVLRQNSWIGPAAMFNSIQRRPLDSGSLLFLKALFRYAQEIQTPRSASMG